ncbi:DUF3850 domain-containing protein [Anaerocolumna sp. AGMB13020]|uniref:DUF3850 domain-containing protein n=1 Tax=Anaerocolumna sp. AGMB13020 TaxID=3081750 RepID=UPI002953A17A|nr:DUF3850 domain-containing protein [Anaerocolumna sp. AGMB13020]WOO34926.1 DUF3850 domain-containing protein [Anaerocolumna sp. AGMB13020]
MELNLNYQEIKGIIRKDFNTVAERFNSIGYHLKKVRDGELYKEDGYKDIAEFALKEYGVSRSNTYRFMQINEKFSVGGDSLELLPEYAGFGNSKLSEMLTLDEEELKLVTQRTTRDEIREINKTHHAQDDTPVAPARQVAETIDFTQSNTDFDSTQKEGFEHLVNVAFEFFNDKNMREKLKELGQAFRKDISDLENEVLIIINPSKHTTFRKGMLIVFFEESVIKVKKFGDITREFTYTDFLRAAGETYNLNTGDPWVEKFGEPVPEIKEPEKKEPEMKEPPKKETPKKAEPPKAETKTEEKPEVKETEENLPGQMDIKEFPEYLPEEAEKVEGEVITEDAQEELQEDEEETKESEEIETEERGQQVHELKTDHIYFADVLTNKKPFELRRKDKDFQVNDVLRLHEQIDGQPTGRTTDRLVTYILENYTGLVDGFCILGIQPV